MTLQLNCISNYIVKLGLRRKYVTQSLEQPAWGRRCCVSVLSKVALAPRERYQRASNTSVVGGKKNNNNISKVSSIRCLTDFSKNDSEI